MLLRVNSTCQANNTPENCINPQLQADIVAIEGTVDKLVEAFEAGINCVNESKQLKVTMIKQD